MSETPESAKCRIGLCSPELFSLFLTFSQPSSARRMISKLGLAPMKCREKSPLLSIAISRTFQLGNLRSYIDSSPSLKIKMTEFAASGVKIALLVPTINRDF